MNTSSVPESPDLIAATKAARKAGLCVVPPREDGTKAPISEWKRYQHERPASSELKTWYIDLRHTGIGYVTGRVSGIECFEFDDAATYDAFKSAAVDHDLDELVERIEQGYSDRSPSGGIHWYYRCDEIGGNTALARRPEPGKPKGRPLIETRGEGGYVIAAPSYGTVHPSRKPYTPLHGNPASIVTITPDERDTLFSLARMFDETPAKRATLPPVQQTGGARVGDIFNERASWPDILEPHGWRQVFTRNGVTYWRRPGKDRGVSATTNHGGHDALYVFTSSTQFEPSTGYHKLTAYVMLNHGDDWAAAIRDLAAKGYTPDDDAGETSTGTNTGSASTGKSEPAGRVPVLVTLSDVESQQIEWLWRNWLPRRMLAILGGYGGDGKSTLLAYLMARLSTGGTLPDGTRAPLTNCLILAAEDDPQYAIRPRLDLHNADVSRIHMLKGTQRDNGAQEWVDLKRDADIMRGIIRQYDIGLVVVDPLSSYMPKADRNSEGDVRDALMPLQQLMEETGVAIIGVMHVGKADAQRRAAQRLLGSTAFTALARTVWMVHDLPDEHQPDTGPDDATEKRKVLGVVKANYSVKPQGLAFSRPLDGPLRWHGPSPVTIEEAFAGGQQSTTREDAEEWITNYLRGGMQPSDELEAAALKRFSKSTYKRARASLNVQAIKIDNRWFTRLPDDLGNQKQESQAAPTDSVRPLLSSGDFQESQTKDLRPFPESSEESHHVPPETLAQRQGAGRQESQIPLIDTVRPLPSDPLPPTGTDGLPEWEV